jgi:predicted transcriptional regulator
VPSQHKRSPLTFRLPEGERARLEEYARARGLKVGTVVADAVREKLDRDEQAQDVSDGQPTTRAGSVVTVTDPS